VCKKVVGVCWGGGGCGFFGVLGGGGGGYFSWALLRNEFVFSVNGLDLLLFVRNEQAWVI